MKLTLIRHTYNTKGDRNIIGDLFIDGVYFCHTLEDEKRADGVKIKHKTAIAPGIYNFVVNKSNRFKRLMILLLSVPMFSGVRMHGGNTSKDTSGCPLVAYKSNGVKIWSTAEEELTKRAIAAGGEGTIEIIDAPLSYDKKKREFLKTNI